MCLATLDKKTESAKIGYKCYKKCEDGRLYGGNYGRKYKLSGRWIKSSNTVIKSSYPHRYSRYISGFHVFKTLDGARSWRSFRSDKIYKVEIDPDSIVASGRQFGCKVIVAQRIKILKEIE